MPGSCPSQSGGMTTIADTAWPGLGENRLGDENLLKYPLCIYLNVTQGLSPFMGPEKRDLLSAVSSTQFYVFTHGSPFSLADSEGPSVLTACSPSCYQAASAPVLPAASLPLQRAVVML